MDWSKGLVLKKIGLNPRDFVDVELSVVMREPVFDLYKFEDYLISCYGETNKSISEIVEENYPNEYEEIKKLFRIK